MVGVYFLPSDLLPAGRWPVFHALLEGISGLPGMKMAFHDFGGLAGIALC
jgi:hypothetical protein